MRLTLVQQWFSHNLLIGRLDAKAHLRTDLLIERLPSQCSACRSSTAKSVVAKITGDVENLRDTFGSGAIRMACEPWGYPTTKTSSRSPRCRMQKNCGKTFRSAFFIRIDLMLPCDCLEADVAFLRRSWVAAGLIQGEFASPAAYFLQYHDAGIVQCT